MRAKPLSNSTSPSRDRDSTLARSFPEQLLLGARADLPRALHQHVADAIEQRRRERMLPVDGDVAAVGEDFRQLPRMGGGPAQSGRYVLGTGSATHRRPQCASSDFNDLRLFGELTQHGADCMPPQPAHPSLCHVVHAFSTRRSDTGTASSAPARTAKRAAPRPAQRNAAVPRDPPVARLGGQPLAVASITA